jgi:hypothetical protein
MATYQHWRKTLMPPNITVLQIPHFSRANFLPRLDAFAVWMMEELKPFQCRERTAR